MVRLIDVRGAVVRVEANEKSKGVTVTTMIPSGIGSSEETGYYPPESSQITFWGGDLSALTLFIEALQDAHMKVKSV